MQCINWNGSFIRKSSVAFMVFGCLFVEKFMIDILHSARFGLEKWYYCGATEQCFNYSSHGCFMPLFQGWRETNQSGGAMKHWKVLSATLVGWVEKCLNSRRSRMPKTVNPSVSLVLYLQMFDSCFSGWEFL